MNEVTWGIIGCGEVTEQKSGPAFNKIANSRLVGVMRRNENALRDYVSRHQVSFYTTHAAELIHHPEINALYIATPPGSHLYYIKEIASAGKNIYVEKPLCISVNEAKEIENLLCETGVKLSVAHYRREQLFFKTIKSIIQDGRIGKPLWATLKYYRRPFTATELNIPRNAWRVNPSVSGGGLFFDLAPHQIDLMLFLFGDPERYYGKSFISQEIYPAADITTGCIKFKSGVIFQGNWNFNLQTGDHTDLVEIYGTEGMIKFPVFGKQKLELTVGKEQEIFQFDAPDHVQQPLIEQVVGYFLNENDNPSDIVNALKVTEIMECFSLII
jgi:predicted dehydrogenase